MKILLDIFSTRELALIIWLTILLFYMMLNQNVRKSLLNLLAVALNRTIGTIIFGLLVYITSFLVILSKLDVWNFSLMKDTSIWFLTAAITLLFTINKAQDREYFRLIILESFKWTLVLEFIINFYTFSLLIELFLLPLVAFISMTIAFAESDEKYSQARRILQNILAIIGLAILLFTTYKTISDLRDLFTINNLIVFLLPPILTILIIPYLYLLAFYMSLEVLFTRFDIFINDLTQKKLLKKEIVLNVRFSLKRLKSVSKHFNKFDLSQSDDVRAYIKQIINKTEKG